MARGGAATVGGTRCDGLGCGDDVETPGLVVAAVTANVTTLLCFAVRSSVAQY
jgi:hypothetical protein